LGLDAAPLAWTPRPWPGRRALGLDAAPLAGSDLAETSSTHLTSPTSPIGTLITRQWVLNGEDSGFGEVSVDYGPPNVPHSLKLPRCFDNDCTIRRLRTTVVSRGVVQTRQTIRRISAGMARAARARRLQVLVGGLVSEVAATAVVPG